MGFENEVFQQSENEVPQGNIPQGMLCVSLFS